MTTNLREAFTANAEQFDSLMVKMLSENERLSTELARCVDKIASLAEANHKLHQELAEAETCIQTQSELLQSLSIPDEGLF